MTRYYFHGTETPSVSPAFDTDWDQTASAVRRKLLTAKVSGDTVTSNSGNGGAVGDNTCLVQLVSEPMAEGILWTEGTATDWESYCHVRESATDDNCRATMSFRIVSSDGGTQRVQMMSPNNQANGSNAEWSGTTLTARNLIDPVNSSGFLPAGNYTTQAGDRLVIELGFFTSSGAVSPNGTIRIGSDSAQSDCPENETDTTSAVPWIEVNVTFAGQPGPPSFGGIGTGAMGFTIAGRTSNAFDWEYSTEANHGDRTLTAKVPKGALWAEQGAPVTIWRGTNDPAWSGTVVVDPLPFGDMWTVRAVGHADTTVGVNPTRMFYRIDGGGGWVENDSDPHGYAASEKYDRTQRPGKLQWAFGDGDTAHAIGNDAGFVFWAEGALITKFEAVQQSANALGNFDFIYRIATGPSGSRTLDGTLAIGVGPTTRTQTLTTPSDLLEFSVNANAASTQAARRRVWLTGIKVYGRTNDDAFSASEVVEDVGTTSGLDIAGVQSNPMAVLPLDWTEDHADLLSYMADLTDWRWLITHTGLSFGPWETVWDVQSHSDGRLEVEPEPRYNRVRVPYRAVSGALREAEAEPSEDPFPGQEVPIYFEELEDPQPNSTFASNVAQTAADYYATVRVEGSMELGRVRSGSAPRSVYDVRAGDLLRIADLDIPLQRIQSVTYRADDRVTVEFGSGFNLVRTLATAEKGAVRKRKRRKKRRRRLPPVPR